MEETSGATVPLKKEGLTPSNLDQLSTESIMAVQVVSVSVNTQTS